MLSAVNDNDPVMFVGNVMDVDIGLILVVFLS
jgi:hypothetical protein